MEAIMDSAKAAISRLHKLYQQKQDAINRYNEHKEHTIRLLRRTGMDKKRFNFADVSMSYKYRQRPNTITYKAVTEILNHYPHVDTKQFISDLKRMQSTRKKYYHTVEVTKSRNRGNHRTSSNRYDSDYDSNN